MKLEKLGAVAEINPRRSPVELGDNDLVSFVPMNAVDEVTGRIQASITRPYIEVKKGYTNFADGDILFAKVSPCMQNGKHAVARNLANAVGFGSTEFHVIRPGPRVTAEWIHYFLRREETLQAAAMTFNGAIGLQRVPPEFLATLQIPVPDLAYQRRTVHALQDQLAVVEEARRAAQAQLGELQSLKASAIADAFSKIPRKCRIGDTAKLQSGYAFKSADFQESGVRLLRNTNILPGKVYWDATVFLAEKGMAIYSSYKLQAGDILISLDRPIISTGIKVARVSPSDLPALLVQRVGRFILDGSRVIPDYFYAFLQSNQFIEAISGHDQSLGVPHISPSQVEDVLMPFTSLEDQAQIAKRLTSIMDEAALGLKAAQAQLDEIRQLPARLLAQAFDIGSRVAA